MKSIFIPNINVIRVARVTMNSYCISTNDKIFYFMSVQQFYKLSEILVQYHISKL
ncbi:MAG: hypothetical protein WCP85_10850 [Mariniphaga sp.]